MNRCVEFKHGRNSKECQATSETDNWILKCDHQSSRSSSLGSIDEKPYCDDEGNGSSNISQEWLGTGYRKLDTNNTQIG